MKMGCVYFVCAPGLGGLCSKGFHNSIPLFSQNCPRNGPLFSLLILPLKLLSLVADLLVTLLKQSMGGGERGFEL